MSIRVENKVVCLEGACLVEDAEALLVAFQEGCRHVDLGSATRLHLAIVQLLIAFKPQVSVIPDNSFIRLRILPLLIDRQVPGAAANDGISSSDESLSKTTSGVLE